MKLCPRCGRGCQNKHERVCGDCASKEYRERNPPREDPDDEQCAYVFPSLGRCQRVVGHRGECNPVPWQPPVADQFRRAPARFT